MYSHTALYLVKWFTLLKITVRHYYTKSILHYPEHKNFIGKAKAGIEKNDKLHTW